MEVSLPATVSFTLEFLFVAKQVVISGKPGDLYLSAWQDRRGEIGDGEIGDGERAKTEKARDVDGETCQNRESERCRRREKTVRRERKH